MSVSSRITSRFAKAVVVLSQCRRRNSPLFFGGHVSSFATNQLLLSPIHDHKVMTGRASLQHYSAKNSPALQWVWFSSTPQPNEKETAQSGNKQENMPNSEAGSAPTDSSMSKEKAESGSSSEPQSNTSGTVKRRRGTKRTAFSDSESDSDSDSVSDLSRDDLVKLVMEKEQVLETKHGELEKMKDKVLRTLAEMENVKERTRRESENAKKFAIQNFAKSLLDLADNLGRASSAAKESFSKIDASGDIAGAVKQLKTLLEGVEMTEKQLSEVFKKFGLERYDPVNEEFDPNRHNAVFRVPDASKPADHVAVVLKAGYMLHDRVIRPAEVGVTVAMNN